MIDDDEIRALYESFEATKRRLDALLESQRRNSQATHAAMAKARAAQKAKYLRRVDPEGVLSEEERERRAQEERTADLIRWSEKALKVRREKAKAQRSATAELRNDIDGAA